MKKTITILFSVFTLCGAQGQSLKQQGTSVEELVPNGITGTLLHIITLHQDNHHRLLPAGIPLL